MTRQPKEEKMEPKSLKTEAWREYDFDGARVSNRKPRKTLYARAGGTTHRVVDSAGVVHCVPAPGHPDACSGGKRGKAKRPYVLTGTKRSANATGNAQPN